MVTDYLMNCYNSYSRGAYDIIPVGAFAEESISTWMTTGAFKGRTLIHQHDNLNTMMERNELTRTLKTSLSSNT